MPAPVMAVHLLAGGAAVAAAGVGALRGDSNKSHSCYRWQHRFGGERSRERESQRKMAAAAAVPVAGPFRGRNAVVVSSRKGVALHAASTRWPGSGSGSGSVWSRSGSRSRAGVCRCRGSAGSDSAGEGEDAAVSSSGSNSEGAGEGGSAAGWDLAGSSKKMQAAAAKMSDPLREMMTTASKRLQDYLDNHRLSKLKAKGKQAEAAVEAEPEPEKEPEPEPEPEPEVEEKGVSEWDRWQTLFAEVEERESLASALKFQLEDAVERQDYAEAAKLKQTIAGVSAGDAVAEVMKELERALQEERYGDAALLRDKAGAGLVGWWSGLGDGGSDPFGRLVSIAPMQGRLVAKSYTARQLASGSPGIPLFEVFVSKSNSGEYELQAVYLQREGMQALEAQAPAKDGAVNVVEMKNVVLDGEGDKKTEDAGPESTGKRDPEGSDVNEGLKVVINFLKGRIPDLIPDLKLNVFQVVAPEGVDIPKIVEQTMEPEKEEEKDNEEANASGSDKVGNVEEGSIVLDEKIPSDFLSEVTRNGEQKVSVRLLLGGVMQNTGDDKVPKLPVRVPATIEAKSRDSFVFNIDDTGLPQTPSKEAAPSWKVAAVATRASAGLMPDDVAKVFWNVDKVPVKVSKEMGEMIRLAVSQAQRRHGLQKITNFTRINTREASSDPLCGLYIGAFGPYTSEVVQVKRKYGCWQDAGAQPTGEKLEFFEYVEAVKLTGDLNVPAGQVTFRAKTGRENRLSHRTSYPEELGVVARFKGQGRLAEPGFRNPHWIDGDLILLDGKSSHTNGAELGFVYSATERNFLILFNRLKLQD